MKNSGFTLLELMIAITIVGLLASLAVPTYQDYTVRAKISEALNMASAIKFSVSEYYISQGELPETAAQAGITDITTNYVQSVAYNKNELNGEIIITLSARLGGTANNKKIVLEAEIDSNILKWTCRPDDENGPEGKYLPASCRSS